MEDAYPDDDARAQMDADHEEATADQREPYPARDHRAYSFQPTGDHQPAVHFHFSEVGEPF